MSVSGGSVPQESEHVEIVMPADADLVVLARFTAAAVAARANFDIDEIEDLRLAVDELCISFGPISEYQNLRLEFDRNRDTVRISCVFEPKDLRYNDAKDVYDGVDWKRTNELSRQLLEALVDSHGRDVAHDRPCAWLEKRGNATG